MVRCMRPRMMMVGVLLTLALAACQMGTGNETAISAPVQEAGFSSARFITLGDAEPDEPAKNIKRFGPLADYLAEHLKEFGIRAGRVVVSRNIVEMGQFLRDATVDIYFDSAFPTIGAQEISGSAVILRRWKGGDPAYWSTYVTLRSSGINSIDGFTGKIVAFEEPHSTSGFVLPAGTLVQRGLTLSEVASPEAQVASDEIGYYFSRDEQNTIELLLQGRMVGGWDIQPGL